MMKLYLLRDKLRECYTRYPLVILPVIKFLCAFISLVLLKNQIGFTSKINSIGILFALAVVCALLPYTGITLVVLGFILINLYSVSLEVFLVTVAVLLIMFCVYYIFQPGDSVVLILVPVLFLVRMPYLAALVLALVGTPLSIIPLSFGTIIYFVLKLVKENTSLLSAGGSLEMSQRYTQMLTGLVENKEMWLTVTVLCLTLWVVYFMKRLSINYAGRIAVAAGTVFSLILFFAGSFALDVQLPGLTIVAGHIGSVLLALVIQFVLTVLDYSRTEYVQFEDDEYYYYVKAVPKITIAKSEFKIQKISTRQNELPDTEEPAESPQKAEGNDTKKLKELSQDFDER